MPYHTAIVLAAGTSTRMGEENKLLLPFRDKTLLANVVEAVCASRVDDVIVVTGHQDRQIRDVLEEYRVRIAYNPEFEEGMATSIRRGVLASTSETDDFIICLGDMPFITDVTITRLIELAEAADRPSIIVTTFRGQRGHPVIFGREFRSELMMLSGDVGARSVIEAHEDVVVEVEVRDEQVVADIDTWEAYSAARAL